MNYLVNLGRAAQKQLDKLTGRDYEAVASTISALEEEPRPHGVKKLVESGLWRIRVEQYRVIFHINDEAREIIVVRVARRKEDTYKGR